MIWNLQHLKYGDTGTMVEINGKYVDCRPINWKYRTIIERFIEAWKVFTGETESFRWPEGQ